jgi:uncharacterized repeat protein (TIGR03803 family)
MKQNTIDNQNNLQRTQVEMKPFTAKKIIGTVLTVALYLGIASSAHAQFSVLYNFGSVSGDPVRGVNPGFIAQGRDGNLYSTTVSGGSDGPGTVFKITPAAKLTVLYSFNGTDGSVPYAGLTLGTDGNFYGGAIEGGPNGYGMVFKVTSKGVLTLLHGFDDSDGAQPFGAPIEGTNGAFYGTTETGGTSNCGTVYKVTSAGVFQSLYNFESTQGCAPYSPLTLGSDGNFYGTTASGGSNGFGTVFKITPAGHFTLLHSFGYSDGVGPFAGLIEASDGKLYGTTYDGGAYIAGTIFEITRTGTFSVIHNFYPHVQDGSTPLSGLVQGSDGNLYGTTSEGGTSNAGTIYVISPGGASYSVLYNFDGVTAAQPEAGLSQNTNGILYGDTYTGGSAGYGAFFSFDNALRPFVSPVPSFGAVGKTIGILGQGFTGTTAVSFNGIRATFHVASSTYLTATVPSGATTGRITVTTPSRVLKSNQVFRVTP